MERKFLFSIATAFLFLLLAVSQVHAQAPSPFDEDQDGDGDLLNEEHDMMIGCSVDKTISDLSESVFGKANEGTLSDEDCDFVMHYLSGKCEELNTRGVDLEEICNVHLSDYLKKRNLFTKDFPTDTVNFNKILEEFTQGRAQELKEGAEEEENKPTWMEEEQ